MQNHYNSLKSQSSVCFSLFTWFFIVKCQHYTVIHCDLGPVTQILRFLQTTGMSELNISTIRGISSSYCVFINHCSISVETFPDVVVDNLFSAGLSQTMMFC